MKIKVFSNNSVQVEKEVNTWLAEMTAGNKIEIVNMFHATSTATNTIHVTITYIYREKVSEATATTPAKYE